MQIMIPPWLSTVVVGVASAAPMFMPFIPPPYNAVAAGVIALVGSIYHLYVQSPTTGK